MTRLPRQNDWNQGWRWGPLLALLFWLVCPMACGSVDQGDATLPAIKRLPDPNRYGQQVHPALSSSCATAGCHGSARTFQLTAAESMTPDPSIEHPLDLAEPYRSAYYTVLGLCELEFPEASLLLRWASGSEPDHPGGAALSVDDQAILIDWLRSGEAGQ